MNTALRTLLVQSEGRYLSDTEVASMRAWAVGIEPRLALVARLERAEEAIVTAAADAFVERVTSQARIPDAYEKSTRDYRLTLRYVAMGYVRDDLAWFRRAFASWIAELFRALAPAETLTAVIESLQAAVDAQLDAADARAVAPYLACFAEELAR